MVSFRSVKSVALLLATFAFICSSLQINHIHLCKSSWNPIYQNRHHNHLFVRYEHFPATALRSTTDEEQIDDEALLSEVDISTLQNLCTQYSLATTGTKQELLARLREFASDEAEKDRKRREGRRERVENNLEGKARHTFVEQSPWEEEEEGEVEDGFFYYAAAETEEEKKLRLEQQQKVKRKKITATPDDITAPNPENIEPNEKGERVVTIYSTTEDNDLTGNPSPVMSMDAANQYKALGNDQPEDSLIGGPFGDTSGSKRKKVDEGQLDKAKENLRRLVGDLLATTGAPAFQDDYEEGDEENSNPFETPYGFVGFQPERIPPDTLVQSSFAMRMQNGKALKEILEEYELQAIGHDGMAADDVSKGGGHYQEVEKVRSFLEGFRKSEDRRVARETSTMLLDRLVKEGVAGLDQLLVSMPKEGDDTTYMLGVDGGEAGELNSALIRYLEEAIREQEQRVERIQSRRKNQLANTESLELEVNDWKWNVTRGEDGTTIETIDLNDPLLRQELERTKGQLPQVDNLESLTVQEKMLLLLKLLRDRVKVEAVMGSMKEAKNLRVLAYCLKAGSLEERRRFIVDSLGNSLDVSVIKCSIFPCAH